MSIQHIFNKTKFLTLLTVTVIVACNSTGENANKESLGSAPVPQQNLKTVAKQDEEPKVEKAPEVVNYDTLKYQYIDSLIRGDIQQLDKIYVSTPFYAKINGRRYYVVCTGKWDYSMERFGGTFKYGIVDDALEVVLEPEFDKIYNPNLTMSGCMEVKRDSKVGLFHIRTGQVLKPQFDYIMPVPKKAGEIAYGYKNQEWYKISADSIFNVIPASFSPVTVLKQLWFDVDHISENLMYDSYSNIDPTYDPITGKGVVILPSYLEHLKLLSSDHYADIIVRDQGEVNFGTTALNMKIEKEKTLYEKIKAFVMSSYEEGIDARGYATNAHRLVVYNSENNSIESISMGHESRRYNLCDEYSYNFVNDSIIEVKSSSSGERYDYQTSYSYFKVSKQGEIKELKSSRQFNYTKFIVINEDYFKGCFASYMDPDEIAGNHNIYISKHLSIEDLDIMRNEIFAEYGYTFKSDKWKKYFAKYYTPRYDNVNDQLTEIDKANIKTILKVRKAMENNEDEYTQKTASTYHPAG